MVKTQADIDEVISHLKLMLSFFDEKYQEDIELIVPLGLKNMGEDRKWVDLYTNHTIPKNANVTEVKTSVEEEKCMGIWVDHTFPATCVLKRFLGLCQLGEDHTILAKGFCQENVQDTPIFDLEYYIFGMKNGKAHIRSVTVAVGNKSKQEG